MLLDAKINHVESLALDQLLVNQLLLHYFHSIFYALISTWSSFFFNPKNHALCSLLKRILFSEGNATPFLTTCT